MRTITGWFSAAFALAALALFPDATLAASAEQNIIDRADIVVREIKADPHFDDFAKLLAEAKGVLVIPDRFKVGFILGGEGGAGVLMARDPDNGSWSPPAFYFIGSAGIGLQAGAQVSQVVLLVMSDGALDKLMTQNVTLGADANIAIGPVGTGVEAGTALSTNVDFYSFARAKGLFFGISLEGAVLMSDDKANAAYYGAPASPATIVLERRVSNPGADALRGELGG
ncbi:MAG: lipid-binding SYLF domain-containing protein [Alphaproteobacteria bacterium]